MRNHFLTTTGKLQVQSWQASHHQLRDWDGGAAEEQGQGETNNSTQEQVHQQCWAHHKLGDNCIFILCFLQAQERQSNTFISLQDCQDQENQGEQEYLCQRPQLQHWGAGGRTPVQQQQQWQQQQWWQQQLLLWQQRLLIHKYRSFTFTPSQHYSTCHWMQKSSYNLRLCTCPSMYLPFQTNKWNLTFFWFCFF